MTVDKLVKDGVCECNTLLCYSFYIKHLLKYHMTLAVHSMTTGKRRVPVDKKQLALALALLAFSVDTGWNGYGERTKETMYVAGMLP